MMRREFIQAMSVSSAEMMREEFIEALSVSSAEVLHAELYGRCARNSLSEEFVGVLSEEFEEKACVGYATCLSRTVAS